MSEYRTPATTLLKDEIAKVPYEPLLPIEKKLIVWSLSLGIVLLIVLGAINRL